MIKKRNKSGFSLLETLIGSVIFIVVLGIMTNFTFSFTNYSNRLNVQHDLADSLNITNMRMIKEIEGCSAVLQSYPTTGANDCTNTSSTDPTLRGPTTCTAPSGYGTGLTGTSTFSTEAIGQTNLPTASMMVLSRRVTNPATYMPYSTNPNDTNWNDVIIIKYNAATGKITFSLIPAPNAPTSPTNSPSIKNIVLTSSLTTTGPDPFHYYAYGDDGSDVTTSKAGSNLKNASLVVIDLRGTAKYGSYIVNKNTEEKISLRNFSK